MPLPAAPPLTASLMVRKSRAAEEGNLSLAGMLDDCRARAREEGLTIIAEHVDDGLSGAIRDRPGFLAWLADAEQGRASVLVTWHADRITREGVNAAALVLDVVEGKDTTTGRVVREPVRLIDCKGLDSRDEDGFRFRFVIAAEVARGERARMVDRALSTRRRLLAAARWGGGRTPYGYKTGPAPEGREGRVLVPHPDEAAVVRDLAARVLKGESIYALARHLNTHGPAPRTAASWAQSNLRAILVSPHLRGYMVKGRRVVLGADGLPVRAWEPILDDDTAARVEAALAIRPREAGRAPRSSRLLSGLVSCAHCAATLYVNSSAGRAPGSRIYAYTCPTKHNLVGAGACPGVSVNADLLDAEVERRFLAAAGSLDVYVLAVSRSEPSADVREIEVALRETTAAMLDDDADLAALSARLVDLKARKASLTGPQSAPQAPRLLPTGQTFSEAWEAADVDGRRALLAPNLAVLSVAKGKRGHHGLDPARVTLIAQPAQPLDAPAGRPRRPAV